MIILNERMKKFLCIFITPFFLFSNLNFVFADKLEKEKNSKAETVSTDISAYDSSPSTWGSYSKHFFITPPERKTSKQPLEKDLPTIPNNIEKSYKSHDTAQSPLRPLSHQESERKKEPGISRRRFLKRIAQTAALYVASQIPLPAGSGEVLIGDKPNIFSGIATLRQFDELMDWVDGRRFTDPRYGRVDELFLPLWQSYKPNDKDPDSRYIAEYGRVWTYDVALAIFAELKAAQVLKATWKHEEAQGRIANAKKAVEGLMRLAKWEEKEMAFKGLWHFSYNVLGDSYRDPRGPLGANLWAINAMYAYIIQTGDTTCLEWLNGKVKTFVFSQQVMDQNDPRYGLVRAGLYHVLDDKLGPFSGYCLGRNLTGIVDFLNTEYKIARRGFKDEKYLQIRDLVVEFAKARGLTETPAEELANFQNGNCFIEHNAAYLGMLRLAALANTRGDAGFLTELRRRHEICVNSINNKFWQGDHYCTAMSEKGEINKSVAVDNNTWAADALMPYDMERTWQCIQFTKRRFMIKIKLGEKEVEGLFFFTSDFEDPYVQGLSQEDRKKLEQMVSPEATLGYVLLLMRYAQVTKDEKRKEECLDLIIRLYRSMFVIKEHFGGNGIPYSTLRIQEYFTMLEGMASNATAAITAAALRGAGVNDFIGVTPPKEFTVRGRAPFAEVAIEPPNPRPMASPIPASILQTLTAI